MTETMTNEAVCPTPEDLEEAAGAIDALIPAGYRYVPAVLTMDGTYLRETPAGCDWSRLRQGDDRRSDGRRAHRVVWRLVWSDRWAQAGGPFMQQQAVLRTDAPRASHPQTEQQET